MHQVRVNFRGIYTRPPKAVLRDLVGLGWLSAPCNLSYASLCRYAWGDAFPSGAPEATDTPGGLPAAWAALGCSNGQGKVYTGAPEYDLSACDVVDQGGDVVYARGVVYYLTSSPSLVVYWFLIVACVFLVRGLSHNIRGHRSHLPTPRQWPLVAISAAILAVVVAGGDEVYVTTEDLMFYWATVGYVAVFAAYHGLFSCMALVDTTPAQDPLAFNLVAGALQLVAVRLYTGAETPYNPVIVFLIGTRVWHKLLTPSPAHACTSLLDGIYLALTCDLAFLPDPCYLIALCLACYLSNRAIFG